MFGGDYFSQSIWSKTANAPSAAMAAGRPPNGVEDEFLSISRIGVVTKENLREADLWGPIQLKAKAEKSSWP
jgi:hypothetical protein